LEVVLQGLHESEIRCGIKNEAACLGGITAWIDYGSRTEKATFFTGPSLVIARSGRRPISSGRGCMKTALRLFPDSPMCKTHKD